MPFLNSSSLHLPYVYPFGKLSLNDSIFRMKILNVPLFQGYHLLERTGSSDGPAVGGILGAADERGLIPDRMIQDHTATTQGPGGTAGQGKAWRACNCIFRYRNV